jgi:hypothetical protein
LALKRAVIKNVVKIQCGGWEDVRVKEEAAEVTKGWQTESTETNHGTVSPTGLKSTLQPATLVIL